ncbi:MAG: MBL fold metallo-hydrolase [Aquificaceae bacterium]|nr:MBL fold metallo-hydrolase [Aquificaceae bacterium]MDW8097606.1 MBL fold metallo-hydrolase [Aquificaceae bacterium]
MDRVVFLGTAGGRASVFRYARRAGGFIVYLSGSLVHVDPGPGAFVYLHQLSIDPRSIDLVVLSHIHLDHSSDVNAVLESATDGGKLRRVALFAPRPAFEGENRVVLPFIRERLAQEGFLREGLELSYRGVRVKAVMKHTHHATDTYALLFNDRLLYVSCALYEDRMLNLYPKGVDLMIVNTTLYRKVVPIDHLTVEDAYRLIVNLKPRKAVLTHFGYELLMQHDPKELAMELSKRCGVPVVAAEDFMEVEL